MNDQMRSDGCFERRSKQAFDASVAALDATTRSRLTRARLRALEQSRRLTLGPGGRRALAAGALASLIAAVWLLSPTMRVPPDADPQLAALDDLELLTGEQDIEMLEEEIEFYAWLEEQADFTVPESAADGVG